MSGYTGRMATSANPLTELIPARARKYVYGIAALLALVYGIFQASDGDWRQFVGALLATLVPLLAASNTVSPESDEALHEAAADDEYADETYFDGHSTV